MIFFVGLLLLFLNVVGIMSIIFIHITLKFMFCELIQINANIDLFLMIWFTFLSI
jgi:hypothetical protein